MNCSICIQLMQLNEFNHTLSAWFMSFKLLAPMTQTVFSKISRLRAQHKKIPDNIIKVIRSDFGQDRRLTAELQLISQVTLHDELTESMMQPEQERK